MEFTIPTMQPILNSLWYKVIQSVEAYLAKSTLQGGGGPLSCGS